MRLAVFAAQGRPATLARLATIIQLLKMLRHALSALAALRVLAAQLTSPGARRAPPATTALRLMVMVARPAPLAARRARQMLRQTALRARRVTTAPALAALPATQATRRLDRALRPTPIARCAQLATEARPAQPRVLRHQIPQDAEAAPPTISTLMVQEFALRARLALVAVAAQQLRVLHQQATLVLFRETAPQIACVLLTFTGRMAD